MCFAEARGRDLSALPHFAAPPGGHAGGAQGGGRNPNRKVAKVLYIDYNLDDVTNATIPPSSRGLGTATTLRDRHAAVDAARDA